MEYLIQTTALTKEYGGRKVVNSLDLVVPEGSIYGFLGPNGSGKTTTIRMLLGLIFPTSGEMKVLGRSMPKYLDQVLPHLGAVVEGPGLYPSLSPSRYLERMANNSKAIRKAAAKASPELAALETDIAAALDRVGLSKVAQRRSKALSLGMKQRLALANALLFPRRLLILDEPTNGMDPQGIVEMRDLIMELSSSGTTVFISSHILSEIEQLCSHVGVIQHGELLFQGELSELQSQLPTKLVIGVREVEEAKALLLAKYSFEFQDVSGGLFSVSRGEIPIEQIVKDLVQENYGLFRIAEDKSTLEEAFVHLTGVTSDVY
ncbi:ABC transporter ATP-binding protein [Acidithrix ferrooxidans]|uniref:Daunorubicin/doxorubicin resistance ATP-binding protein DrrA n=1 Tax=Acidithrix ferrooxidans TaxID=1280514 RepID=A0A0D8HMJ8_9ACTN|nr:ABC transporter ATP-binding protein [Acidithrix ferrooxidans]KJF19074.1 daunorubicin/doxorubicin resistance ATP-binding protein DrrA [Acidithrix ferrooxidans]